MDEYGYGATLAVALDLFEVNSRATGRTERLVMRAQEGDCIITTTSREVARINLLLKTAGRTKVEVRALAITEMPPDILRAKVRGRVLFDHLWIFAYYKKLLATAAIDLVHLRNAMSGSPLGIADPHLAAEHIHRFADERGLLSDYHQIGSKTMPGFKL